MPKVTPTITPNNNRNGDMCGVVGTVSHSPNHLLYDALLLLQHRGQMVYLQTMNGNSFTMHKANGLVRDVFRTRNMRSWFCNAGIGQVRHSTAGSASSEEEAQLFTSVPYVHYLGKSVV